MEFDIRNDVVEPISSIRIANVDRHLNTADCITQGHAENRIKIKDTDSGTGVLVDGKKHALDLIKGLHKAIELGWLK